MTSGLSTRSARRILGLGLGACLTLASTVAAQEAVPYCVDRFDLTAGPTLVPASGWKRVAGKATLDLCKSGHTSQKGSKPPSAEAAPSDVAGDGRAGFPSSYSLRFEGKYLLVHQTVRLPDATALKGSAAWSISLAKPPARAPADLAPEKLADWQGGGFDYGFIDLGMTAGYEASADRRQQNFALGGELRYGSIGMGPGRLVPSVVARYERIDPMTSSTVSLAPLDSDVHWRASVLAYWRAPLALEGRLAIQAEVSVFRARGLEADLVAAGWRSGAQGAATLSLIPRPTSTRWIRVNSLYLRYSDGKQPTAAISRRALTAGLAVGLGG